MTRKPRSHVIILIYLMCGFQSRFFISLELNLLKMPPTVYAKLFFIIIFLIIKIYCFQKTLRAENFVIAVGGRPRFPFEVSEVFNKFILKVLERLSLRFQVAVQIQQVGRESNRQGFLLVLFFFCFPLAVAGGGGGPVLIQP